MGGRDGTGYGKVVRRAWLPALLAAHFVLAWVTAAPVPDPGGDSSTYLALAESLRRGLGYLELWDPAMRPHSVYPPVFPALLAAAGAVGVRSLGALAGLMALLSAGALAATWLLLRARFGERQALAAVAVLALAPGVLVLASGVLSDVPFWLFTALALWLLETSDGRLGRRFLVGAAFAVAAYFTRLAGLPLLLAVGVWLLGGRRWRELGAGAALLAVPAVAWWLRVRELRGSLVAGALGTSDPYTAGSGVESRVAEAVARVWPNLRNVAGEHLPELIFGWTIPAPGVGALLLVPAAVGLALTLRTRPRPTELFFVLYVGMLLVWVPAWGSARYLLPVAGLLLAYLFVALESLRGWRPAIGARAAPAAALFLIAIGVSGHVTTTRARFACVAESRTGESTLCMVKDHRDFQSAAQLARTLLPEDAVVLSRKPSLFYAISGRRSRLYPRTIDGPTLRAAAHAAGSEYILADQSTLSLFHLRPALASEPERYCVLALVGGTRTLLLRVLKEGATARGAEMATVGSAQPMRACEGAE